MTIKSPAQLSLSAILIHPRCKTLLRGLGGAYRFERIQLSGEEVFHDKPVKDMTTHAVESLHYMIIGSGVGPLMSKFGNEPAKARDAQGRFLPGNPVAKTGADPDDRQQRIGLH
jgi:hypothetical protein